MSRLYEDKIDTQWSGQTNQPPNSPAFRLHKTKFKPKKADELLTTNCKCHSTCQCYTGIKINPDLLILNLGLTSVKDSLATNECKELADTLSYLGYELYKKHQMFLADMVTNHVIMITSDGLIPTIRAGGEDVHVLEEGLTDVKWRLPCVTPSPVNTGLTGSEDCVPTNNEAASNELFQCILRYLHKELGLKPAEVGAPKLLAVYYNKLKFNKPELIFSISSQLTSKNITDTFAKHKTSCTLGFVKTIDMMIPLTNEGTFPISQFSSGSESKCSIRQVELKQVDELFKDVIGFCLGHQVNFNSLILPLQGLG